MFPGGAQAATAHLANDGFTTFPDLLARYRAQSGVPSFEGATIAIAGPVGKDRARLTNRDPSFDLAEIAAAPGMSGSARVRLISDLVALGQALVDMPVSGLETLGHGPGSTGNGQALVVGLGTGVNLCAVADGAILEAEYGHAGLPVGPWRWRSPCWGC